MTINYATSAAGTVRGELPHAQGSPIPGYTLDDCPPLRGDVLDGVVRWKDGSADVGALAGRAVRLRFVLHDADLYALCFAP